MKVLQSVSVWIEFRVLLIKYKISFQITFDASRKILLLASQIFAENNVITIKLNINENFFTKF